MSENRRKNFMGEFEAKVAFEVIRGAKTANEIGHESATKNMRQHR